MVRLADLPGDYAQHLLDLALPTYDGAPWATPVAPEQARVALISTAGVHRKDDPPFSTTSRDYRLLPADLDAADLAMSHISVNFDRAGFQQDVNIAFPLERLHALADAGEIGSVASWHYSFMGATDPSQLTEAAQDVARLLKEDGVTAALFVPV